MLTWHVVWMASHGREMTRDLRQAGAEVTAGRPPVSVLRSVVGVAVLKEGFEVVLFLYGNSVGGVGWQSMMVGAALGLLMAA